MSLSVMTTAPEPPTVHAPARPAGSDSAAAGAPASAASGTPAGEALPRPVSGAGGAQVTASVPAAGSPPPASAPPVSTPGTTVARPTPPAELAKTGLDSGPLLLLALTLVLLGVFLVRLASPRST